MSDSDDKVQRSIRSLERRLAEHEQKLADCIKNPEAFDNQGLLTSTPSEEVRQKIIQGRIRKLQGEIETFKSQIAKLRGE